MYISRILEIDPTHSLLLFGARGTGKSSLLEHLYNIDSKTCLYINLLDPFEEDRFARDPGELIELIEAKENEYRYVIIDEIQKNPKLLDIIHLLIEKKKKNIIFVLTGSSARKLKAGGANLLAGRAFVYNLYPFSYLELKDKFDLQNALCFGMLPKIFSLKTNASKQKFLQTYAQIYLKEEVWLEQLVRKLPPFRKFLEVAAQCNGKIINYSNLARDVGVDDKTIKNYFTILEDTLLGFMLEPFVNSFRKRLCLAPKFYFIDTGIARALGRTLSLSPKNSTSYYGDLFEQFIICECIKLASYNKPEYRFSYLMTGSGVEIDLIVERPGEKLLLIEIKSKDHVTIENLNNLKQISLEIKNCEAICFSQDKRTRNIDGITIFPWQIGIKRFF